METSQSYKHIEIELSEELIERQEYIQSYAPCIETFMGCTVMFAVGLNMPVDHCGTGVTEILHAFIITILMFLGKYLVSFFYLGCHEADINQIMALAMAMNPRGSTSVHLLYTAYNEDVRVLSIVINSLLSCFLMGCVKKLATARH